MAVGTDAGLLREARPQSVYKHGILDSYMVRFATMTASTLTPRRSVLVDGFAGRGRYENNSAASAEYMMLAAQKAKGTTQIDTFLVEERRKDFLVLDSVAEEYRARGLKIVAKHGDCGSYIDDILALAKGASLFLFLDPCGANLPWGQLAPLLGQSRGARPRTEALLNFNAGLTRRAGGQLVAGQLDAPGVLRLNTVCGGEWWQRVALDAFAASGRSNWEGAASAVAVEYAKRLAGATGTHWAVIPVYQKHRQQPIYHLVFLTHDRHGLWVMGHATSVAREKWLQALGPTDAELEGMLFSTVDDQIAAEHERAVTTIKQNLVELVSDGRPKPVVQHTTRIFGEVYGEARETAFTRAVRELVKAGAVEYAVKGRKPHKHVLKRPVA